MTALTPESRAGDDAARLLYERHGRRVLGYCRGQLGSLEEAEDAAQTTFLRAINNLRKGVVPECEIAWLLAIARTVCADRRRSNWRRGRLEATSDPSVIEDCAAAPAAEVDALIGLPEALAGMPQRQRRAILLREWQGLSYGEIADRLGLSRPAVEALIFRARRSLAKSLHAGTLLGWLRSALQGGAAVKGAAALVVLGGVSVAAAPSLEHRFHRSSPRPARRAPAPAPARTVDPVRARVAAPTVTTTPRRAQADRPRAAPPVRSPSRLQAAQTPTSVQPAQPQAPAARRPESPAPAPAPEAAQQAAVSATPTAKQSAEPAPAPAVPSVPVTPPPLPTPPALPAPPPVEVPALPDVPVVTVTVPTVTVPPPPVAVPKLP